MRISQYFLPIIKENPREAKIVSHSLMLRSGMIQQQAAGIYSWLPLGLKVLHKIEHIIREEMSSSGAIELLMPCIQPGNLWVESGRFDSYGKEMLKFKDRHDNDLLFGPTNEDMITDIFRRNIKSYKDLPKNLYHIQWKFRDEIRPRFGIMRGREFLMKDAYSFDIDEASALKSYNNMYMTYMRIFKAMGVKAIPVVADNGPIGGKSSHEFHIRANTGESEIYYDKRFETSESAKLDDINYIQSLYAAASEKHDKLNCPIAHDQLVQSRGIEVGHIFYIGNKYTKSMGAFVNDKNGVLVTPEMSSYGIGVSRLAAAIIEASHDEQGIIWPKQTAPFVVSLINLAPNDEKCLKKCDSLYIELKKNNIDVLYDDSSNQIGHKLATHDLIGSPWQIVVGPKKLAQSLIEIKTRKSNISQDVEQETVIQIIETLINAQ